MITCGQTCKQAYAQEHAVARRGFCTYSRPRSNMCKQCIFHEFIYVGDQLLQCTMSLTCIHTRISDAVRLLNRACSRPVMSMHAHVGTQLPYNCFGTYQHSRSVHLCTQTLNTRTGAALLQGTKLGVGDTTCHYHSSNVEAGAYYCTCCTWIL